MFFAWDVVEEFGRTAEVKIGRKNSIECVICNYMSPGWRKLFITFVISPEPTSQIGINSQQIIWWWWDSSFVMHQSWHPTIKYSAGLWSMIRAVHWWWGMSRHFRLIKLYHKEKYPKRLVTSLFLESKPPRFSKLASRKKWKEASACQCVPYIHDCRKLPLCTD